ncbi:MAG: murein L,D-transpeptidase family protein [Xanthobacteraceae bacterium]
MNRYTGYVRTLTASAAIAVAVALAGCQTNDLAQIPGRAMQPLPRETVALIEKKGMAVESPILVRIYKEESELEVWKQDRTGRFALLKTYPICRWSGALGPKKKQGDRQAPEGFYTITPGQMNPKSSYYLAFNLGFPNAYDRSHGYSGAFLMVHGDCSSSGCYSMSDEQMAEIYALGREAFLGGQKSFQVQALPFRMTALNLAKHRDNPNMAFWRMLKEGTDQFEVTRLEPRVDACGGAYVFGRTEGAGGCAGRVPQEIAAAVDAKQDQDNRAYAAYVARGTSDCRREYRLRRRHASGVRRPAPAAHADRYHRPPGGLYQARLRAAEAGAAAARTRSGLDIVDPWAAAVDPGRIRRPVLPDWRIAEQPGWIVVRQLLLATVPPHGPAERTGSGQKRGDEDGVATHGESETAAPAALELAIDRRCCAHVSGCRNAREDGAAQYRIGLCQHPAARSAADHVRGAAGTLVVKLR